MKASGIIDLDPIGPREPWTQALQLQYDEANKANTEGIAKFISEAYNLSKE